MRELVSGSKELSKEEAAAILTELCDQTARFSCLGCGCNLQLDAVTLVFTETSLYAHMRSELPADINKQVRALGATLLRLFGQSRDAVACSDLSQVQKCVEYTEQLRGIARTFCPELAYLVALLAESGPATPNFDLYCLLADNVALLVLHVLLFLMDSMSGSYVEK